MKTPSANPIKPLLALFFSVALLNATRAQQSDLGRGGIYPNAASIPRYEAPSKAEINFSVRHIPLDGYVLRTVSNTVYNLSQDKRWSMCEGEVYAKSGDYIIISYSTKSVWLKAVKNYPGDATDGMHIRCIALRSGTVDYNGTPLAAWDCGLPYHPPPPPPPTAEQLAAQKKRAEAMAIKRLQKSLEADTNAFIWLKSQAATGDSSAQLDLAMRYLSGRGCETNQQAAIVWL